MLENYTSLLLEPERAKARAARVVRARVSRGTADRWRAPPAAALAAALAAVALSGSVACGGAAPAAAGLPDGRLALQGAADSAPAAGAPLLLGYHGGEVLRGTVGVYLIWYGTWAAQPAQRIVPALVRDLAGSAYLAMLGAYGGPHGAAATDVELRGETVDAYSAGRSLGDGDVAMLVMRAIATRAVPLDPGGIYLVLASADVRESSGLCTSYCGFHQSSELAGQRVRWAFVGNPSACMSACAPSSDRSPNGDAVGDAMASIVAHEISESITDPDLDAWYDTAGAESGDKCSWTFGATFPAANGARANVRLGARSYLLQQIWSNDARGCTLAPP